MILLDAAINVSDLFTPGSFTTLAGTTGIVYIVCSAIQQAFNYSPKWLALVVSMLISFIAAYIGLMTATHLPQTSEVDPFKPTSTSITYLLAFLNGFLIYLTATGTNQFTSKANQANPPTPPVGHLAPPLKKVRKFNTNWWSK